MPDTFDPFDPFPEAREDAAVQEFTTSRPPDPAAPAAPEDPFRAGPVEDSPARRRARIGGLTAAIAHGKDEIRHTGDREQLAQLTADLARNERALAELLAQPKPVAFLDDPFHDDNPKKGGRTDVR